jgi:PKD repeat protein
MDPNTSGNKVSFYVGDVGASAWEEISIGGTDYPGVNYGWPDMEGPCKRGNNRDCSITDRFQDPFYYYEHTGGEAGGAVVGSAFVPNGLWPTKYKFLFIDFVFGEIYNLIEEDDRECRQCRPPVPGYRNETFHRQDFMVDMFFGPYKNTQALYVVARGEGQTISRIRYTGSTNRAPVANIKVGGDGSSQVAVGETIILDGSGSNDADGDELDFLWDFGDGESSRGTSPQHSYSGRGEYEVSLTVTDEMGQTDQTSITVVVGIPPTAIMISPADGNTFFVGQVLRLVGSAQDADGNQLTSSQLFWEVRQHHSEHFHPFLDRRSGNDFDLFPAPEPEDLLAATNSYLEVIMTARDENGLTTSISRRINPKIVLVDVDSSPQGLEVMLDEYPVVTPATITTWENHDLRLDVLDQFPFIFDSWFDGGARSHPIRIPPASSSNLLVSVSFTESSVPTLPFASVVRDCTAVDPCNRCEGHCQNDSECDGALVCYKKGGRGLPVPGCIGIDNSRTDWCTLAEFSVPEDTPSPSSSPFSAGFPEIPSCAVDCIENSGCCSKFCQMLPGQSSGVCLSAKAAAKNLQKLGGRRGGYGSAAKRDRP